MPRRIGYLHRKRPKSAYLRTQLDVDQAAAKKEADAFYTGKTWRECRRVFLRANPLCVDCRGRGELTPAKIPHHVEERLLRPDLAYDHDNLVALCSPCHTRRHKSRPIEREKPVHPAFNKDRPMVLALDFNGVIHDHVNTVDGKGPVKIDSPAVEGAIDFLLEAAETFTIAVVSARFSRPGASGLQSLIEARAWLIARGIPEDWITFEPDRSGRIFLTGHKVPYLVSIDDRSIRFDGTFPSPATLAKFKPWNVPK